MVLFVLFFFCVYKAVFCLYSNLLSNLQEFTIRDIVVSSNSWIMGICIWLTVICKMCKYTSDLIYSRQIILMTSFDGDCLSGYLRSLNEDLLRFYSLISVPTNCNLWKVCDVKQNWWIKLVVGIIHPLVKPKVKLELHLNINLKKCRGIALPTCVRVRVCQIAAYRQSVSWQASLRGNLYCSGCWYHHCQTCLIMLSKCCFMHIISPLLSVYDRPDH